MSASREEQSAPLPPAFDHAMWLMDLWRGLRDDNRIEERCYIQGAIQALYNIGVLGPTEEELWRRRIETCPGHDDEGKRAWCSYGCKMPEDVT